MTDQWVKLAEPFPESEVKQRPGSATWAHKDQCQGPRCRETGDPDKHKQLSYVDAATVIRRLNDVMTPGGWDFSSSVIPGTDIVHGVLTVGGAVRDDYGYPNGEHDAEPIKSASSDALKRCAALFGVGLHLRNDNTSGSGRATPPARPSAAPRLAVAVSVDEDPTLDVPPDWDLPGGPTGQASEPGGTCPDHGTPWTLKEAGVSKTGRAYDAFWKCDGKYDDGSFCKNKPPKAWAARHER